MRHRVAGIAIFVVGALLSWLAIGLSFDPLFVVGSSEPATISGPTLGQGWVATGALLLLALAGAARRGWRIGLLLAWLAFLALATHRIVEHGDGRVADIWLGVTVQSLAASAGVEAVPRCRAEGWLVRCPGASGRDLVTLAPFFFAVLSPGAWDRPRQDVSSYLMYMLAEGRLASTERLVSACPWKQGDSNSFV